MLDIKDYAEYIDRVLPGSGRESDLIAEVYNTLTAALPTTSTQAFARLSTLESFKPQLSSLIFAITMQISDFQNSHDIEYYKLYTKWTNVGTKPSHQAIEAQIYKDNLELFSERNKIKEFQCVLDYVKSLNWDVDKAIEAVKIAWKDSNNY